MNEPVAWAREDGVIAFHKKPEVDSQGFKWYALYTHPAKYCPSENNEAYEKGFIDGMAKQRDSAVQRMVEANTHPAELTAEEITEIFRASSDHIEFARAILRKAQEK